MEDYKTIEKAMIKIIELAKDSDPKSTNQIARWVNTKEDHATNIQNTIYHKYYDPLIMILFFLITIHFLPKKFISNKKNLVSLTLKNFIPREI